MMDTREAFVNVLVEIHLNQQSLETCKKNKQTNQKNIANTYKKKTNQAKTRFSAFHWITVFFFGEIFTLILPQFCIVSDNLSHHMLHQNEIWETFPLWKDCLLVFSLENQWLLSISCSHIVFLSDVFFFIFSLFFYCPFSVVFFPTCCLLSLFIVLFYFCSKCLVDFFFFLSPIPTNSLSFFLLFRYHKYFWLNRTV